MKKIFHDCDPGHDDMVAIMVACAAEGAELVGVTTVAGNQTGDKTYLNARKVLTLVKRGDLPLARGADKPLMRELETAPHIHGASGLDGAVLPEPAVDGLPVGAVELMAKVLSECGDGLTLVPTGPLTNVAALLLARPELKPRIERVVFMGGAARDSNITPGAEFNVYVDPEAAEVVFSSGLPITQVPLDVSNKTLLTFEDIDRITRMDGPVSRFAGPLLRYFAEANRRAFGIEGAPVHDALAMCVAIDPTLARTRRLNVAIERYGQYTRGQTVVDLYGASGRPANVDFVVEVDVGRVREAIIGSIAKLDALAR